MLQKYIYTVAAVLGGTGSFTEPQKYFLHFFCPMALWDGSSKDAARRSELSHLPS